MAFLITLLFLLSVIAGLSTPPRQGEELSEALKEQFRPLAELHNTTDLTSLTSLTLSIFMNNLRVTLLNLVLGVSVIGPAGVMMVNGYVVGVVLSSRADLISGVALILPHGLVEIPTLIYSAALGTHLGITILSNVFRNPAAIKKVFREVMGKIPILALLLLVAALIEVFVTMLLVAPLFESL